MQPIPVAVIGCGHLGTFHARLYRELPDADLRVVVDRTAEKARGLGESLGVAWSTDVGEAIGQARAISVATPTSTHREVAGACLEAGRAVLVEKPLAVTRAEGEDLLRLSRAKGALFCVGHVERFNPAFVAAREAIAKPRFVESHRLSTFVLRSLDVDVVLDLMIHDLDLVLSVMPSPVEACDAVGVPVLTDGEDIANARLRFADGAVANLTASRVSKDRVRKIRFFAQHRYVSIDLMAGRTEQVVLERLAPGEETMRGDRGESRSAPDGSRDSGEAALLGYLADRRLRLHHGEVPVPPGNALKDELADFLGAVAGGRLVGASGEDGLKNLDLALRILERMRESRPRLDPGPERI